VAHTHVFSRTPGTLALLKDFTRSHPPQAGHCPGHRCPKLKKRKKKKRNKKKKETGIEEGKKEEGGRKSTVGATAPLASCPEQVAQSFFPGRVSRGPTFSAG
jgi:hypothetical protein